MNVYLDSSVVLRMVLNQKESYTGFHKIKYAVSSELLKTECLRTADRFRAKNQLNDVLYAKCIEAIYEILKGIELVTVNTLVLNRAAQPFSIALGTLDAIHLATCLLYNEHNTTRLALLTHDTQLSQAARVSGLEVWG